MTETEIETFAHDCGNRITIHKIWVPGGVNDYGGYVLKCRKCKGVFHHHLGRDINASKVASGADVLDTYDDDVGNKADVLKKHGLAED
jgi:hypothetical protein